MLSSCFFVDYNELSFHYCLNSYLFKIPLKNALRYTQTQIQEEPIVCHNDEELLASNKAGSRWTTVVLQFQLNTVETMLAETMTARTASLTSVTLVPVHYRLRPMERRA